MSKSPDAEIERLRQRLNEVDAQLTAEGRIHARECMALRTEKDAEIELLLAVIKKLNTEIERQRAERDVWKIACNAQANEVTRLRAERAKNAAQTAPTKD